MKIKTILFIAVFVLVIGIFVYYNSLPQLEVINTPIKPINVFAR